MKILIAILLAFCLGMGSVAADELWIRNEGGVEVTIWSGSNWQEVTVTGNQGLMCVGPGWEPADGVAKVAAVTVPNTEWLVIHADNITDYRIDVASNQRYEDIMPELRLVKDAPVVDVPIVEPARDYDSGPSIQEVAEPDPIEYDWTGQEVWLWT